MVKRNWVVVDDGSGARGRDCEFSGQPDDAVAEVGVAEEGEVAEGERWEVEEEIL